MIEINEKKSEEEGSESIAEPSVFFSGRQGKVARLMVVFLLLLVLLFGLFINVKMQDQEGLRAEQLETELPPARVVVLRIRPVRIVDAIDLPGIVRPWEELTVRAQVAGQVTAVHVKEGDHVDIGQGLVQIDERGFQNTLDRIQANYELAGKELARQENLAKKNVTAQASLDMIYSRFKEVAAQRAEAELALSHTRITAPLAGMVNELSGKEGSYLSVGDPLATLLDIHRVKIEVGIPESDVTQISHLKHCPVSIDALDGLEFTGKRIFLAAQPQNHAQLYELKLEVPNPKRVLLPGMFAKVHVVKEVFEKAISVPLYSVMTRDQDKYVFIVDNGTALLQLVETGVLSGRQIQITKGLNFNDQVVIMGQRILEHQRNVKVDRIVASAEELFR